MKAQRGGFMVGLVIGLLIGLALALGVALYVTKVPVPFINKVPQRTAEQDAAETERNKSWDPNAPLGRPAPRPPATPASAPGVNASPARQAAPATAAPAVPVTGATAASSPKAARQGASPLIYFAQAGAFTRSEDAEAQRAKLALLGLDAKVSEREQAGRTVYRVRVGPFEARAEADAAIERLQAASVEASLVRVERQ
jgi:cell division protein FtsN